MGCFPCSGRIIKCKAERINRRMPLQFVCMTLYNKILDFGVAVMASLFWGRRGGLCPNLFIEPSRRGGWYPGSSRAGITPRRPRGVTVVPRMAPVWGGKERPCPSQHGGAGRHVLTSLRWGRGPFSYPPSPRWRRALRYCFRRASRPALRRQREWQDGGRTGPT